MKTKYDWRNIPDWISYVAIDSNGDKFGYEVKPKVHISDRWTNNIGDCWTNNIGRSYLLENVGPCENWKDSLEKRPKVLGTKQEIEQIIKFILQDEDTDCGHEVLCSVIASRCAEQIIERLKLKP